MNNLWVVNASPLILLGKIGQLDLLPKLAPQLVVPSDVVDEVTRGPSGDPSRDWLAGQGRAYVRPNPYPSLSVFAWDLGAGESAVLAWATAHSGFEAIIDDRAARKCATVLDIPFRGTLGVILAARRNALIPTARPLCRELLQAGLLIDIGVVEAALRLVGE